MDKPISAGDLVVVVKPPSCCGSDRSLGYLFRVLKIEHEGGYCMHCGKTYPSTTIALRADMAGAQIWRLKRIPPLGELDDVKKDEEITA